MSVSSAPVPAARVRRIAIIGGGPAGLMAAETLALSLAPALTQSGDSAQDWQITVFDAMPSLGRKFLLAGKSGLNLTHAEDYAQFVSRYGSRSEQLRPWLDALGPAALREWAHGLGVETFVGSSGRVFPKEMKAAPLLRAWLHRLREAGVRLQVRHRWLGWTANGALHFATPAGEISEHADATLLALGGGSWPQLGSDGAWLPLLAARGVTVQPLRPANCGFYVDWSEHLRSRFAGEPLKNVIARCTGPDGQRHERQGEFVVSADGIEGSLVYALAAPLRDRLQAKQDAALQPVLLEVDLLPGKSTARLQQELARPRGRDSLANHLRRQCGLTGVKAALLRELLPAEVLADPARLAAAIKALPIPLRAARPLAEAISSAGGVDFAALDENLMLRGLPGVFCAGEMLDWEAPTGGYLLTGCFASGKAAGAGMARWLGY